MSQAREVDVIDVNVIEHPLQISRDAAWNALHALVLKRAAVDLNGPHSYDVRVKPVRHGGDRRMGFIVAAPRGLTDKRAFVEGTFMSMFGEVSGEMFAAAEAAARAGIPFSFATSLAEARQL